MKHKIIGEIKVGRPYFYFIVQLIPESEQEKKAVQKVENIEANEDEQELVDNYLLFGLRLPYSIVGATPQAIRISC